MIVDAWPKMENRQAFIRPLAMVTLLHALGSLKALLEEFRVLSLSWWRKVGLPLEVWQESWPNFKGITKGKVNRHQSLGFSKV